MNWSSRFLHVTPGLTRGPAFFGSSGLKEKAGSRVEPGMTLIDGDMSIILSKASEYGSLS